jgi:hypothetical protein
MVRWRILRTLLWKEALRFRYNLGLLVVIGSLLALSALVSLSSQMVFGQQLEMRMYYIVYDAQEPRAVAFAQVLKERLAQLGRSNAYRLEPDRVQILSKAEFQAMGQPDWLIWDGENVPRSTWKGQKFPGDSATAALEINQGPRGYLLRYFYPNNAEGEILLFHRWCEDQARGHFQNDAGASGLFYPLTKVTKVGNVGVAVEGGSRLSKIVTALVIFAFYLLSFNIFITTTAEEREKKALLAVMLTPARPLEIILAKVIFYATLSVLVAMGVVAMYKPYLLGDPLLWLTIFTGASAYVAIGTVVLCMVRRQTTINNVSMMYLIFTAVIMLLGTFLWGFNILRELMIENYLFRHLEQLIDGTRYTNPWSEQIIMTILAILWIAGAVLVFRRRGVRIGHVSR